MIESRETQTATCTNRQESITTRDFDRENYVALLVMQALLGNVSPGLHGVAVELAGQSVKLHILIDYASSALEEDLDDIVADLEGMALPEELDIALDVTQDADAWPGRRQRMIFLRREI